jgi:hypothetical protein
VSEQKQTLKVTQQEALQLWHWLREKRESRNLVADADRMAADLIDQVAVVLDRFDDTMYRKLYGTPLPMHLRKTRSPL